MHLSPVLSNLCLVFSKLSPMASVLLQLWCHLNVERRLGKLATRPLLKHVMLSAVCLCRLPTTLDADSSEQSTLADLCFSLVIYRQASARRNIRLIQTFPISRLAAVVPRALVCFSLIRRPCLHSLLRLLGLSA